MPRSSFFECFLQISKLFECATHHNLRLAIFAVTLAHFVEAVIDQIKLQFVLIDTFWLEPENAHASEHELDATCRAEVATEFGEDVADIGHRTIRVVGGSLHQYSSAVWRVALVGCHIPTPIDRCFLANEIIERAHRAARKCGG